MSNDLGSLLRGHARGAAHGVRPAGGSPRPARTAAKWCAIWCATPSWKKSAQRLGALSWARITIIYDHHSNDLQEKLHTIQHDYFDTIISTMHVHVDEHMCLEVIVMRGETGLVQSVANLILGTKGVKNGKLVLTTTGRFM